jgi:hypothetical protein
VFCGEGYKGEGPESPVDSKAYVYLQVKLKHRYIPFSVATRQGDEAK